MATISAIVEAIASQLGTIPGLNIYPRYPDQIIAPAVVLRTRRGRAVTLSGPTWLTVDLVLYAASIQNGLALALERLEPYLEDDGDYSMTAALESDPTLGALVDDILVQPFAEYDTYKFGEIEYSGCRWEVEVIRS